MSDEKSDFEKAMSSLQESVDAFGASLGESALAKSGKKVPRPFAAFDHDEVHQKAVQLRHLLRRDLLTGVEYAVAADGTIIHWDFRDRTRSRGGISISIREFMGVSFSARRLAVALGAMQPFEAYPEAVSGNHWERDYLERDEDHVDPEEVEVSIAKLASSMLVARGDIGRVTSLLVDMATSSRENASRMKALSNVLPDEDSERTIKARAEHGVEAMILDIQAEVAKGDNAVREKASKWLAHVTDQITSVLKGLDEGGD